MIWLTGHFLSLTARLYVDIDMRQINSDSLSRLNSWKIDDSSANPGITDKSRWINTTIPNVEPFSIPGIRLPHRNSFDNLANPLVQEAQ
jgi:hypothetical protein